MSFPSTIHLFPDLVAHRGNQHEFPENTLPALRSALELGARYIEFDVHLSADRVPVVMHDSNLKRCAGIDQDALEMTWQELSLVNVGEATRFSDRYLDICIPSLTQVVELLAHFPDATAFVELKRASLQKHGNEFFITRVCEMLKPVASQVIIISFDLPAIHYVQRNSNYRVGWVLPEYNSLTSLKAEATVPPYLFCDHEKLPADGSRLWRGPWHWAIYEVTTPELAMDLFSRGAVLIETMEIRNMMRQLRNIKQRSQG
ncbi:MAG TPA: glycerophosphodiester phosphodiesterase family protein [Steroidobacteraceae bacterium]|nr:glycerophosphodiester phosphodiesterase family protein [Steroidobacteraceae bacterium]